MAKDHRSSSDLLLPFAVAVGLLLCPMLSPKPPVTIPRLQDSIQKDPRNPALYVDLGRLLMETGHTPEAIAAFRQSLHFAPDNVPASCGLAEALLAQSPDKALEARSILELSLAKHPGDGDLVESLGSLLLQGNQPADRQAGVNYIVTALRQNPTRARAALWLSKIYESGNDLPSAATVLLAPLKANERSSELHLQLARILSKQGKYDQAIAEFNAGTARDPNNAQAYCDWGVTLVAAHRPDAALRLFERCIELQPNEPLFHVYMSRALWQGSRFTDAQKEIQIALDKNPAFIPAYLELAADFESLRTGVGRSAAAANYAKALSLAPRDFSIRLQYASFLLRNLGDDPAQIAKSRQTIADLMIDGASLTDDPVVRVQFRIEAANSYAELREYTLAEDIVQADLDYMEEYADKFKAHLELREALLQLRQKFRIAQYPSVERNLTPWLSVTPETPGDLRTVALAGRMLRYAITGSSAADPVDKPWPNPLQPRMDALMNKPVDFSQRPGPGNALDPALYVNLKPFTMMGAM